MYFEFTVFLSLKVEDSDIDPGDKFGIEKSGQNISPDPIGNAEAVNKRKSWTQAAAFSERADLGRSSEEQCQGFTVQSP